MMKVRMMTNYLHIIEMTMQKKIVAQVSKKRVKCSFKCNPLVAVIGQKKHSWRTI